MRINVTVVDYGRGNLFSVRQAFEACGADVRLADSPSAIENADRLVLPGVGAFGDGMAALRERSLIEPIKDFAESGRPFLGICLGMQLLLDVGEEFGVHHGLSLIPGKVTAIPSTGSDGVPHKIPHIGWNTLHSQDRPFTGTVLHGLSEGTMVYFVHSFMAVPDQSVFLLANCDYNGRSIAAVIQKDSVVGCQFHPEKSGKAGLQILRNFVYAI
jgi:imidazole glycerol-phosphate synthase subunit HisH